MDFNEKRMLIELLPEYWHVGKRATSTEPVETEEVDADPTLTFLILSPI